MGVIYALFVCTMVNSQPANCGPAVTETFATLSQCDQMKTRLHAQERGAARLFCMKRPVSTWSPTN